MKRLLLLAILIAAALAAGASLAAPENFFVELRLGETAYYLNDYHTGCAVTLSYAGFDGRYFNHLVITCGGAVLPVDLYEGETRTETQFAPRLAWLDRGRVTVSSQIKILINPVFLPLEADRAYPYP